MARENTSAVDTAQIRDVVEARARAVRGRDADAIGAVNSAGVVTFDVLPPLVNVGSDTVHARTRQWLDGYVAAPGYEVMDLEVVVDGSVALAFYLYRVSGRLKDGADVNMWVRCTLGLQRLEGTWRIVHEHDSVPFDPKTGRAVLDAQP